MATKSAPKAATVNVGDNIPPFTAPPITRTTLALYAGASGDHNPMHIDSDFAKKAGESDVFAHGMLSMGYLSRALLGYVPQSHIRRYGVRFQSIVRIGEVVTCTGTIVELIDQDGEVRARIDLVAKTADGRVAIAGDAIVALS